MDSVSGETLIQLKMARDRCSGELKKMRRSVEGMQAKVLQLEAKLEMAEEMLAIASKEKKPT